MNWPVMIDIILFLSFLFFLAIASFIMAPKSEKDEIYHNIRKMLKREKK